jgi:hypothetical protein
MHGGHIGRRSFSRKRNYCQIDDEGVTRALRDHSLNIIV